MAENNNKKGLNLSDEEIMALAEEFKPLPAERRLKIFQPLVPGYILFFLLEYIGVDFFAGLFRGMLPERIASLAIVLGALVMLLINRLYCLPYFKGMLTGKRLGKGLALGGVFFGMQILLNLISSIQLGLTDNKFPEALALALAAGFGEEVFFRGPGIANFMRAARSEKKIPLIFWLSSLMFGLMHLSNLVVGANLTATILQVISATASGMLFCAILLRTGNLWPCIIFHTLVDLACTICKVTIDNVGIVTTEVTAMDWVYAATALPMAVFAVVLVSKEHWGEIMEVWAERWNKDGIKTE